MAVVALIPTGRLEHDGLAPALELLFPGHNFVVRPPEKHMDGFTSCDVKHYGNDAADPVPTNLKLLAAELVNSIFPGRRGDSIDFAFVVEDVELCNQHQPELVLRLFRNAVDAYIAQAWPQQADARYEAVRERCSFHLFRPMTEAYFFGDPAALERAGTNRLCQLPENLDLEQFQTIDAEYLALPPGTKPIKEIPDRARHPKSYLHYLCDPTLADPKKRYRETHQGAAALSSLNWARVVAAAPHCPFVHALLDDLAEALNVPLPFVQSRHADSRTRFPGPENKVLRNL